MNDFDLINATKEIWRRNIVGLVLYTHVQPLTLKPGSGRNIAQPWDSMVER